MGLPLTIQEDDDRRLEDLKTFLGVRTKVDVLRKALEALEAEKKQRMRLERIKKAARLVAKESRHVNQEFQAHSRLKKT